MIGVSRLTIRAVFGAVELAPENSWHIILAPVLFWPGHPCKRHCATRSVALIVLRRTSL
jgi:hypothetical protein